MNELVSIIMPTYKGANIIAKSINSIIQQTYSTWELLIIDDNGQNTIEQTETEKVIKEYNHDSRIRYFVQAQNKGGSVARNIGISNAKGNFLCFLDDDDCFMPDKLEKQIEYMTNHIDVGMLYTGVKEIYPSGRVDFRTPMKSTNFMYDYLRGSLMVCSSSFMLRKSVIDNIGLWDESFKRHQDMEFVVRVSSCNKVDFLTDFLVLKYREDRNLPTDGYLAEKYREHYLAKMKNYIETLTGHQQAEVYFKNYLSVGKVYLKNKNIKNAIRIAFKSKQPIRMFYKYFEDAISYIRK